MGGLGIKRVRPKYKSDRGGDIDAEKLKESVVEIWDELKKSIAEMSPEDKKTQMDQINEAVPKAEQVVECIYDDNATADIFGEECSYLDDEELMKLANKLKEMELIEQGTD